MAMPLEDRIKQLEDKLKQAKALAARKVARAKAGEAGAARKIENNKKVIVGAFVMDGMKRDGIGPATLTYSGKSFDGWVKRPSERELFGLAPLPEVSDGH
jgi:hypothetical protein